MNTFSEIYKGIGYSDDKLANVIKCISTKTGMSIERTLSVLTKRIMKISEDCRGHSKKYKMELRDYQDRMARYMIKHRGAIVAFKTGVGKTLTAVTVILCSIQLAEFVDKDLDVYIVTPASLCDNMKKEMASVGVDINRKNTHFYTYHAFHTDYNNGKINKHGLLVCDEAHDIRKDYLGLYSEFGSTSGTRAETMVKASKHMWKVLVLTATPVYTHDYDIANLVAMVHGRRMETEVSGLMASDDNDIRKYKDSMGVIMFQEPNAKFFPKVIEKKVRITMDVEYYNQYYAYEINEIRKKNLKGTETSSNAFYTKMRTVTNAIPNNPKFKRAIEIIKENDKTIFYSEFKDYGVKPLINMLKAEGISYTLVSGDVCKANRQKRVDNYNAGKYKVLIITRAGGQGLDTKGTNAVILLEKGWTRAAELQVIGRGARYKSHMHLPVSERVVKVYHLMIVKPTEETLKTWVSQGKIVKPKDAIRNFSADEIMNARSRGVYKNEIVPMLNKLRKLQITDKDI